MRILTIIRLTVVGEVRVKMVVARAKRLQKTGRLGDAAFDEAVKIVDERMASRMRQKKGAPHTEGTLKPRGSAKLVREMESGWIITVPMRLKGRVTVSLPEAQASLANAEALATKRAGTLMSSWSKIEAKALKKQFVDAGDGRSPAPSRKPGPKRARPASQPRDVRVEPVRPPRDVESSGVEDVGSLPTESVEEASVDPHPVVDDG